MATETLCLLGECHWRREEARKVLRSPLPGNVPERNRDDFYALPTARFKIWDTLLLAFADDSMSLDDVLAYISEYADRIQSHGHSPRMEAAMLEALGEAVDVIEAKMDLLGISA
jgi:hypothetical protein